MLDPERYSSYTIPINYERSYGEALDACRNVATIDSGHLPRDSSGQLSVEDEPEECVWKTHRSGVVEVRIFLFWQSGLHNDREIITAMGEYNLRPTVPIEYLGLIEHCSSHIAQSARLDSLLCQDGLWPIRWRLAPDYEKAEVLGRFYLETDFWRKGPPVLMPRRTTQGGGYYGSGVCSAAVLL